MSKRPWLLLFLVACLLMGSLVCVQGVLKRQAKQRRKLEYQRTLSDFSGALKPGLTRIQVDAYIQQKYPSLRASCCTSESHNSYLELDWIGSEASPWYCSESNVYLTFHFETLGKPLSPPPASHDADTLKSITLWNRLQGCL